MSQSWFPRKLVDDDDIFALDTKRDEIERQSITFLAELVQRRLKIEDPPFEGDCPNSVPKQGKISKAYGLAKGRFLDLTCTAEGEEALESVFNVDHDGDSDDDVIRGAIMALQSLLIMGTQVGLKGSPDQFKKFVSHLKSARKKSVDDSWDRDCAQRLKYDMDMTAGTQLLAELKRKRTMEGAFDLLVDLGAWNKHEDLALLRSGFPTRFIDEEERAAKDATSSTRDPDEILELRKDFRQMKVYTIDGAFTADIDDGLSVEVLTNEDGSVRNRFWIHIADADRWAPRDSNMFMLARQRATSIYIPTGSVHMFPPSLGTGVMSLRQGYDCNALSLGVELLPDGSINTSSILMSPSTVRVSYRLTYDEVDEMLEEGVGYNEEWQLGAMLAAAKKRRALRISNGSSEGMVQSPIPQGTVNVVPTDDKTDVSLSLSIEVSHNSGVNQTSTASVSSSDSTNFHPAPVSQAFLLVTEMMILAGEAIGKWRESSALQKKDLNGDYPQLKNELVLPYRCQSGPDFKTRIAETNTNNNLRISKAGGGYCQAWYYRRFFKKVRISEMCEGHAALGLDCYVQWTSPIRRFSDLQVHAAVKRYLRRERINELLCDRSPIPPGLTSSDLGCAIPTQVDLSIGENRSFEYFIEDEPHDVIDFKDNLALSNAARPLQRKSQEYWMFEYIRRLIEENPNEVSFSCVVLGCVDPVRQQYAIYLHELGLEHRYLSEIGELEPGKSLWLKVLNINPRQGLLTFTIASKTSGLNKAKM